MKLAAAMLLIIATTTAFADEKTVALTQTELNSVIAAQTAAAVAKYAESQAAAVYAKISKAFAPEPKKEPDHGKVDSKTPQGAP